MKGHRRATLLATLVGLVGLSGAGCPFVRHGQDDLSRLPPALSSAPTLEEIATLVNRRSESVSQFSSTQATVSGTGFPSLRASVAFERPRRFRMIAGLAITGGNEVDVGSNEELFWFWIRRNQPPGVFFCRHDEFAVSPIRQEISIDPYWLMDAFGLVEFDPSQQHQGPFPVQGGYEIRSIRQTPEGPAYKVTVVDSQQALVLEQRVYDARGQLLASATTSHYRRDPPSGMLMPSVVQIQSPANRFSLRIDLGAVQVNQPMGNPQQLFAMPSYDGSPAVNICRPRGGYAAQPAAATWHAGQ